jgi:hypothetical protein
MPFSAFALGGHKAGGAELEAGSDKLRPYTVLTGYSSRINADGLLIWAPWNETSIGYVQVHRNGIVESVSRGIVREGDDRGAQRRVVYSESLEIDAVRLVLGQFNYLRHVGFSEPFVVLVALLGAASAQVDYNIRMRDDPLIGRNPLLFDEVVVEEAPDDDQATARLLRPIFDQLANAGGRATSQHFEPDGSWKLRTGA